MRGPVALRAPARERALDLRARALEQRVIVLARPARNRRANPHADARAERNRHQIEAEQPPGLVDRDDDDWNVGRRFEQRERSSGLERSEHAGARARALGIDHRADAALADPRTELADRACRALAVAAVDDRVAAAAEVERDAGQAACELTLR